MATKNDSQCVPKEFTFLHIYRITDGKSYENKRVLTSSVTVHICAYPMGQSDK